MVVAVVVAVVVVGMAVAEFVRAFFVGWMTGASCAVAVDVVRSFCKPFFCAMAPFAPAILLGSEGHSLLPSFFLSGDIDGEGRFRDFCDDLGNWIAAVLLLLLLLVVVAVGVGVVAALDRLDLDHRGFSNTGECIGNLMGSCSCSCS